MVINQKDSVTNKQSNRQNLHHSAVCQAWVCRNHLVN